MTFIVFISHIILYVEEFTNCLVQKQKYTNVFFIIISQPHSKILIKNKPKKKKKKNNYQFITETGET